MTGKLIAAALFLAVLLLITGQSPAHFKPGTVHNREHAITYAFCKSLKPCPLGDEAIRVARCESGPNLWPYASNGGVYLGMFQAGPFMRARYGFSWSPWAQARQAFRYWQDSGWSPWECAGIVGAS